MVRPPPLVERTEIIGPIRANVYASTTQPELLLFLSLWEVAPDGERRLLTRGWLRGSLRCVDRAQSTYWHVHHPFTEPSPVPVGEPVLYELNLVPTAHVFRPGYRIALRVSSSDVEPAASFLQMISQGHLLQQAPSWVTIHHDAEHPSVVYLPITDGNRIGTYISGGADAAALTRTDRESTAIQRPRGRNGDGRAAFHPGVAGSFGTFATGVTVVTARTQDGQPIGITVNSFTSVSLDPPLILWCLNRTSASAAAFMPGTRFAVTVLGEQYSDVALQFAGRGNPKFTCVDPGEGSQSLPVVPGIHPCQLDCTVESVVTAGDHLVVIGRVHDIDRPGGPALVFHEGRFGRFASSVGDQVPLDTWEFGGTGLPKIMRTPSKAG